MKMWISILKPEITGKQSKNFRKTRKKQPTVIANQKNIAYRS